MKSKSHIYQRIVLLLVATLISWSSYGQANFESNVALGNWNDAGSWILISGSDVDNIPDANDDVTILSGHNISLNGAQSANSVIVNAGGTLTATLGGLTVTTMSVNGTYIHDINGGIIPTATWDVNSNCIITGVTGTAPTGFNQSFGNLTWDCAGQTANIYTQASMTVQGDLRVLDTGSPFNPNNRALRISNTATGYTVNVLGDFFVDTNASFKLNNSTGSCTLNISGNLTINGVFMIVTGAAPSTATVTGDVIISGGTLNMNEDGSSQVATLNIGGDLSNVTGTLTESGGGSGSIIFNGSGPQNYTSGGTVTNNVNFTINQAPASTVTLLAAVNFPADLTITSGIFDTNGQTVTFDGTVNPQTISGPATQTFDNFVINKGVGTLLTTSGITTLNVADFTQTQGNFTSPTTVTATGGFALTAGTYTAGTDMNVAGDWTNTGGTFAAGAGTVTFTKATGSQTLNSGGSVFNNILHTGAGTLQAGSAITATTLDNGGASDVLTILDMVGNTLTATTIENTGATIRFSGAANGLAISTGTIDYYGAAQTIASGTYETLNITAVGTKMAGGAITTTTLDNGGASDVAAILDMAGNSLTASSIDNTGATIRFSGVSNALAIPTGTVEYYGSNQTIISGSYDNLTINQSSGQAITGGDVTVEGILDLNSGNLNLIAANILTLGATASISGASPTSMIIATPNSEVRKTFTSTGSFTFPVGENSGTTEYSPVSVTVNSGTFGTPYVGVTVVDGKHPDNASATNFLSRYWNITNSGITDISIAATYLPADINGAEGSISSAQVDGSFDQSTNPWVKYSALGANTLVASNAPITSGQTSVFTGITGTGPTATINIGAGTTACVGETVALVASVSSGGDSPFTYTWSPATGLNDANIANPIATPAATLAYTVTITDANGIKDAAVTTIAINSTPAPAISTSGSSTCDIAGTDVTLTSDLAPNGGTNYQWYKDGILLAAETSQTILLDGSASSGDYTVTVEDGISSCFSVQSAPETVLINDLPDTGLTLTYDATTVCEGEAITVTIQSSVSGVNYQLFDNTPAAVSGVFGGTGGNLDITTSTLSTDQTSLTVRATNATTTCTDDFVAQAIIVNAQPVADAGTGGNECDLDFILNATASIGAGTWSKLNGPGNIVSFSTNANDPSATVTVDTYGTYIFRWTEVNNGCTSSDDITVNFYEQPVADLSGVSDLEMCSDAANYVVVGASSANGSGILWSTSGDGSFVNNTILNPTYVPGATDRSSGSVDLTMTVLGGGSCGDANDVITVTITPAATADAGSDAEICEDPLSIQTYDFSTRTTQASVINDNAIYNWVANPIGSGSFNDPSLLNPTFDIVAGYSGTITFTLTAGGTGSCGAGVDSFDLTVNPTPTFSITSAATIINNGELTNITITTTGGFVQLTNIVKDPGISGNSSLNTIYNHGFVIQDILTNSQPISQDITYTFTAFQNSCTNPVTQSVTISVNPPAEFEVINGNPILCPTEKIDITVDSETSGATITLIDSIISPNPYGISGMTLIGTSWSAGTTGLPFTLTDSLVNLTDTVQTVRYIFEVNASGLTSFKFTDVVVNPLPDFQLTLNDPYDSINTGTNTQILINTTTQNGVVVLDSINKTDIILGNTSPGVSFVDGDVITDNLTNGTNGPQTITYYFSSLANGCINADSIDSVKVVVLPAPELVITNNLPGVCPTVQADIDLYSPTANAEVELMSVSISPNPLGVTGFSAIGTKWTGGATELVAAIYDNLINNTDTIQTITYELRISANGFTVTTTKTVDVDVKPQPGMTINNLSTGILGGTSTDIQINSNTENGQITLKNVIKDSGILGNTSAGVSFIDGQSIVDELTNSTDTILNIAYIFEAIANGCINPITDTAKVVVNPIPDFTITNNSGNICPTEKTSFTVESPTANAEISLVSVSISPNPAGVMGYTSPQLWTGDPDGLSLIFTDSLQNQTDKIQTVIYEFSISANGYSGTVNKSVSVAVKPLPKSTITNNNPVINVDTSTDILINTNTENGEVLLLQVLKDPGLLGNTSPGVRFTDGQSIVDELINSTDSLASIKYIFRAEANDCQNSMTDTIIVVVNPNPQMSIINNSPNICSNENGDIILNSPTYGATIELIDVITVPNGGSVSGITGIGTMWNTFPVSINDVLSQSTNLIQKVEYVFKVSVPGYANPVTQSAIVDVKPLPTIDASAPDICSGSVTNIDIWNPNSVTFTVFNWTVTDPNGNISGESPGAGNRITQVLDNTATDLDSVIYRIFASAQSCAGDSIDIIQHIYPQNIANAGTDTVVCQGTPAITIETASKGGGSTDVLWTVENGGGTLSGASTETPTYYPSPADEVGTITLELTASNASVCSPVTDLVSIIIKSKPVVDAGSDQTICEGSNALLNEAIIGGSASAVTWTDATGLGSFSPNPNTLNAFFVHGPSQVGDIVKLYITTDDPTAVCGAAVDSLLVTINNAPEVDAGFNQIICEGSDAIMSGTSNTEAGQITWSGGLGSWTNVNSLSAVYTPAAEEVGRTIVLTVTSSDPSGPCLQVSDQVQITIQKAPEVYAGSDKEICEGESIQLADATTGGSTTSVTWSGGAGSFSPNNSTLIATYNPKYPDEVGSTITLTTTTNAFGPCLAVSDQVNITIEEAPTVNAGTYAPVCIKDTVQLNGIVGGSASSAAWSGGVGIFIPDRNSLNAMYVPDSVEQGGNVILTLTTNDPAGVCNAVVSQTTIRVNRLPSPKIFYLDDIYQVDDASVNLVGEPSPGTYSGPGIIGNTFVPAIADTGTHIIRYTHTDANGCTNFTEKSTLVLALPPIIVPNPEPFCLENETTDNLLPRTEDPNLSDSWSGDNVSASGGQYYYNSKAAGVGRHEVTYTVVDNTTGAIKSEPKFVFINDVPRVDFIVENNCIADSIQFRDLSKLDSAHVFNDMIVDWKWEIGLGPDFERDIQNPIIKFENDKPDTYFVKLTAETKYGCFAFLNKDIEIGAVPNAEFTVGNLTFGQQSIFTDVTDVPNEDPNFFTGYNDPTSSIDSIWWDFEEDQQFGLYSDFNVAYHQFNEGNREYQVILRIKTNLGCFDSDTLSVSILQSIAEFPYDEPFENFNAQAYRPLTDESSWELKVPSGAIIQGNNKAWVTSRNNNRHNHDENSFVALPAFDIRSLERPMLKLDIWSNAESTRDGAALQYSFDGGDWFTLVDPENTRPLTEQIGVNWYDERGLVGQPGHGMISGTSGSNNSGFGWTGVYKDWKTARFPLDHIQKIMIDSTYTSVRFRVVFSSDEQNPQGTNYDGFAFDNLWIGNRTHNVLMEHFDNLFSGHQINLMNSLSEQFTLDMVPLQYHTKYPTADTIYLNNTSPVETRGSIYDINQSPRAFMDGIKEYDFNGSTIQDYQIINRSLIDPLFNINVQQSDETQNAITLDITITATDTLNEDVSIYVIPIETSISSLDILATFGIDSLNNIVKDLFGYPVTEISGWQPGTSFSLEYTWDLNLLGKENYIYDPTTLGVIVFVQNSNNQGSREIYQAVYQKLPVLQNTVITGLEDELNARRIETADIYPNPAEYYFNVALSSELTQDMKWTIFDQRGVVLLNGNFEAGRDIYEVDANKLPNGLHLMIFNGDNNYKVIRKIIISR